MRSFGDYGDLGAEGADVKQHFGDGGYDGLGDVHSLVVVSYSVLFRSLDFFALSVPCIFDGL